MQSSNIILNQDHFKKSLSSSNCLLSRLKIKVFLIFNLNIRIKKYFLNTQVESIFSLLCVRGIWIGWRCFIIVPMVQNLNMLSVNV